MEIVVFWYNNRLFSYDDDVLLELINRPSFAWRGEMLRCGMLVNCFSLFEWQWENDCEIFSIDQMESRSIEFIYFKMKTFVYLLPKKKKQPWEPSHAWFARRVVDIHFRLDFLSSRLCNLRLLFWKKKKEDKNRGGGERIYNTPNLYSAH